MAQGVGRIAPKTIVEIDDLLQMRGESVDEVVQAVTDLAVFSHFIEVWGSQRGVGREILLARRLGLSYLSPDLMGYGRPSVGGESRSTVGVEAAKGTPKADTASLKYLRVGKRAASLVAHDGMNQMVVTSHGWPKACRGQGRVGGYPW